MHTRTMGTSRVARRKTPRTKVAKMRTHRKSEVAPALSLAVASSGVVSKAGCCSGLRVLLPLGLHLSHQRGAKFVMIKPNNHSKIARVLRARIACTRRRNIGWRSRISQLHRSCSDGVCAGVDEGVCEIELRRSRNHGCLGIVMPKLRGSKACARAKVAS